MFVVWQRWWNAIVKPAESSLSKSGKNNQVGIRRIKTHNNWSWNMTKIACPPGANVGSLLLVDTPVVTLKTWKLRVLYASVLLQLVFFLPACKLLKTSILWEFLKCHYLVRLCSLNSFSVGRNNKNWEFTTNKKRCIPALALFPAVGYRTAIYALSSMIIYNI